MTQKIRILYGIPIIPASYSLILSSYMYLIHLFFGANGRLHRSKYLMVQLYCIAIIMVCLVALKNFPVLHSALTQGDLFKIVFALIFLITFSYSLFVSHLKRLRDIGKPWQWTILAGFTIPISTLILSFIPGQKGKNAYGEDPIKLQEQHKKEVKLKKISSSESSKGFIFEIILIIIIVLFIRTFIFNNFKIYGPSMLDSYYDGELIMVNKFTYADLLAFEVGKPERGDVVVFTPGVNPDKKYLIKRVIGIPGDKLKFEDGYVSLWQNDDYVQLDESAYLSIQNLGNTCVGECLIGGKDLREYVVPEGKYFLMGDNRTRSQDSRTCFENCSRYPEARFVDANNIQGKVGLSLGDFDIKSFSWMSKPRWGNIPNEHTYSELEN